MKRSIISSVCIFVAVFFVVGSAHSAQALDRVHAGDKIKNVSLRGYDGHSHKLLSARRKASVFYFFRPDQGHAVKGLKALGQCVRSLKNEDVSWVLVVSDSYAKQAVQKVVRQAALDLPILIDKGDMLYGKLRFRLHPMLGVTDQKFRLVAVQPYRQVNFSKLICAQTKFALGKIDARQRDAILHPQRQQIDEGKAKLGRQHKMVQMFIKVKSYAKALEYADRELSQNPDDKEMAMLRAQILKACPDCQSNK